MAGARDQGECLPHDASSGMLEQRANEEISNKQRKVLVSFLLSIFLPVALRLSGCENLSTGVVCSRRSVVMHVLGGDSKHIWIGFDGQCRDPSGSRVALASLAPTPPAFGRRQPHRFGASLRLSGLTSASLAGKPNVIVKSVVSDDLDLKIVAVCYGASPAV